MDDFVRMERDTPWRSQIGCSFLLGLVLVAVAGAIAIPVATHWKGGTQEDWVPTIFVVVFGGIGLLMWFMGVHQRLASRTPETEVWIKGVPVHPGGKVTLRVRQPGPVALLTLRGRLLCEVETWHAAVRPSGSGSGSWDRKYPHDARVFDFEGSALKSGESLDHEVEVTVPADARPSMDSGDLRVKWRIEVWGRVRHWPDFMHPFTIQVVG